MENAYDKTKHETICLAQNLTTKRVIVYRSKKIPLLALCSSDLIIDLSNDRTIKNRLGELGSLGRKFSSRLYFAFNNAEDGQVFEGFTIVDYMRAKIILKVFSCENRLQKIAPLLSYDLKTHCTNHNYKLSAVQINELDKKFHYDCDYVTCNELYGAQFLELQGRVCEYKSTTEEIEYPLTQFGVIEEDD